MGIHCMNYKSMWRCQTTGGGRCWGREGGRGGGGGGGGGGGNSAAPWASIPQEFEVQ